MSIQHLSFDGATPLGTTPNDFNLDRLYQLGYTSYRGKPIIGLEDVKDHIDSGTTQAGAADGIITYTFSISNHITGLFNNPNYGLPDSGYGYSRFTADQQVAARSAIQLWDDLIPQKFVEQTGLGNADITLANSLDPGQAYAFYPSFSKPGVSYPGDVFTNDPNVDNWSNNWFTNLGYGNTTLIHELGHTLGLSHPGAYNYDPDVTQDYVGLAEYAQDSTQYSIMSYWDPIETGARVINWSGLLYSYAQTPMLHDILTIQDKYGADPTTRAGDTVYGFHSNAGNALFDFGSNPYPFLAVYDAGGRTRSTFRGSQSRSSSIFTPVRSARSAAGCRTRLQRRPISTI
jgi:serralysin